MFVIDSVISPNPIVVFNEKSLHAALKSWYAQPGDRVEAVVDGFVIDIVRENLLIEIQTRSLSKIRQKITSLLQRYPLRLVYPIAQDKWIIHVDQDGNQIRRPRLSPKHQKMESMFHEFVHLAPLARHENFSLHVVLVEEEEIQVLDGKGSWRRHGRSIQDRRLLRIIDTLLLSSPDDYKNFLPSGLQDQFTSRSLAAISGYPYALTQRMLYSMRQIGIISIAGKSGRQNVYSCKYLSKSSD